MKKKILFGTRIDALFGVSLGKLIIDYAIHVPSQYFKKYNISDVEILEAGNIFFNIFGFKCNNILKCEKQITYQLLNLIVILKRNVRTKEIIDVIQNRFHQKILSQMKSDYYKIFTGAFISNGVVVSGEEPMDFFARHLFQKKKTTLTQDEENDCKDLALIIKETFYSFQILKNIVEKDKQIPRAELMFETYKKSIQLLTKLFGSQTKTVFTQEPDFKLFRNALTHLGIIYSGNCNNFGEIVLVDRNRSGKFRGFLELDYEELERELFHVLMFISQLLIIFPYIQDPNVGRDRLTEKIVFPKNQQPSEFFDYRSGSGCLVQNCSYCKKEITHEAEGRIKFSKVLIEYFTKDEILDKYWNETKEIKLDWLFCNQECFTKFLNENCSDQFKKIFPPK